MTVIRGQAYTIRYTAWNQSTSPPTPVTGDANNHTVYVDIDGGSSSSISVTITEIDSNNRPGEYKFLLPGTYTDGNSIGIYVKSSTPNVRISPITIFTERGEIAAIRTATDQLAFTSGNVHAHVKVNQDKTGYEISPGGLANIAAAIWGYIVEAELSALKWARQIASVLINRRICIGGNVTYMDYSGTKARILATEDRDGNRNITYRDDT